VFAGGGKTHLCKSDKRFVEVESLLFKYKIDDDFQGFEDFKAKRGRVINPDFPSNIIGQIVDILTCGIGQLVPVTPTQLDYLIEINNCAFALPFELRKILIYPTIELMRKTFAERYRQRGNSESYISKRIEEYPSLHEQFKSLHNYEQIEFDRDVYLNTVVSELGI